MKKQMMKKGGKCSTKKGEKKAYKSGGKVKMRGTGCAKKGIYSRGPMA